MSAGLRAGLAAAIVAAFAAVCPCHTSPGWFTPPDCPAPRMPGQQVNPEDLPPDKTACLLRDPNGTGRPLLCEHTTLGNIAVGPSILWSCRWWNGAPQ